MTAEIARPHSVRILLVGLHKRRSVCPASAAVSVRVEAANHNCQAAITRDTLHKFWDELDYHLDICRVTRGAHIESL
jgi:hypothetical protein